MPQRPLRFAIVGGGVTGLAAAHRLAKLAPQAAITLFESDSRLGGVLETHRQEGFLLERGADSLLTKHHWAIDLCQELDLEDQLIPTNTEHRRALVVHQGKLHRVPEGFVLMRAGRLLPILRTPVLSLLGKLRLLTEPWRGHPDALHQAEYDESVASFARRRLGRETLQRLVQPLLAGIYTADPEKLSLAATMPEFLDAERQHGSLRRAIAVAKREQADTTAADDHSSGARYGQFVSLRDGMGSLIDALRQNISGVDVRLETQVTSVCRNTEGQWAIRTAQGEQPDPFGGVLIATPAPLGAKLLEPFDPRLSTLLRKISYASSAVVNLAYRRDQIAHALNGFGFVVPAIERRKILAASFSSVKFPGRVPDAQVLVRAFFGGAMQREVVELPDDELQRWAESELGELLGIQGEPSLVDIVRWRGRMPQYHVGHVQLVDGIESQVAQHSGLELAGNAYRGVGIGCCIHSAQSAAERLVVPSHGTPSAIAAI